MTAMIEKGEGRRALLHPRDTLRYFVAASVIATLVVVWLALRSPKADVDFRPERVGPNIAVLTPDARFVVAADAPVHFRVANNPGFVIRAERLADSDEAHSSDRRALADHLRSGTVTAQWTDLAGEEHQVPIGLRPGRPNDLGAEFWLSLACGLIGLLFGLGVWAVRPDNWAARCYALGGLGLFVTFGSDELNKVWNVATDRATNDAVMAVNVGALNSFAFAFLALFARFPQTLLTGRFVIRALAVGGGALVAALVAAGPGYIGLSAGILIGEFAVLFSLVAAQTWLGRSEKASRASLAIMIVAIGLGIVLYLLVTVLPAFLGLPQALTESAAQPLFMLIYGGIGLSIVRAGLFALDRLTRTIMISICLAALVLLLDIALVGWLSQQSDVALGLAIAAVAIGYLPIREWLLRRSERRRDEQARRSLHLATALAFAPDGPTRAARWRAAIQATFEPIEIGVDPAPRPSPTIGEHGLALHLPAVVGAPGLVCRHANAGQRPFVEGDVEAARALITIVDGLVEARDAFTRGASEERRRIARDLHDDVSGRLMTSLHHSDPQAMRHEVREAMADIRVIVNGLIAEPLALGEVFADVRHEAKLRLDAANVTLRWPMGPEFAERAPVAYPIYRHIVSVVRESVSNIIRHADATTAEIGATLMGDALIVSIADDGCGMGPMAKLGNGLGNCARRAAELGGDFEIVPAKKGSTIRFRVYLARDIAESAAIESSADGSGRMLAGRSEGVSS